MNKFFKLSFLITLLAAIALISNSCKKEFDAPPGATDPNMVANTTIAALKALHTTPGTYDIINSDIIISGVVIANDKSGNLYKQLFIQDTTGAIQIAIDASSLYGTYPVGRRIFVKCKGLCISDYNNTPQLGVKAIVSGAASFQGIPGPAVNNYVIGGSLNNPYYIRQVSYGQLIAAGSIPNVPSNQPWQNKYLNDLVELSNYRFTNVNDTYADTSVYKDDKSDTVINCNSNRIVVRTSGFANFAAQKVSGGRGNIVALYTIFRTTPQLVLRDTLDIHFSNEYNCPPPLFEENFNSIGANNLPLTLPNWKNIGETGGVLYQNAVFGGGPVKCAKISAFSTAINPVVSWLISPSIALTGASVTAPRLTFTNAAGFNRGTTTFAAYISTDYNGGTNPSAATWTLLPATYATAPTTGFSSFVESGDINLTPYIGQNVYIGFKYTGGDPTSTTTWEMDDFKIYGQ